MPIKDLDPISPLDVLVTEIDTQITSQTERLIACKAVDHDHITGILKGLNTAKQRAIELRKTWYADEAPFEPAPEPDPYLKADRTATSRRLLRRV
jgi:hypothetical protein